MKKGIVKKILCGLTICVTGLTAFNVVKCAVTDKDYIGNKTHQSRVIEELDADMQIMQEFSLTNTNDANKLIRLKPNSTKEIYINIDRRIKGRERENINSTIDDFNTVFKNINDSYKFVICETPIKSIGRTSIDFVYTSLPNSVYGMTKSKTNNFKFLDSLSSKENCYITDSTICLDKNVFSELSDVTQLFVLKHELLHTLGFSDIYTGYDDETSLMNVGLVGVSTKFSPNDLKMLYVAYGNKHINSDGTFNQEKMNQVKAQIDAYEQNYYKYLMSVVRNNVSYPFQLLNNKELNNLTFTKNNANISINNGEYEYTLNGETKKGKLIVGDYYAVIPDIKRQQRYDKEDMYNDFLVIAKINDKITCYDIDIYHSTSKEIVDKAVLGLEIELN